MFIIGAMFMTVPNVIDVCHMYGSTSRLQLCLGCDIRHV